jgi:hypothetical protein
VFSCMKERERKDWEKKQRWMEGLVLFKCLSMCLSVCMSETLLVGLALKLNFGLHANLNPNPLSLSLSLSFMLGDCQLTHFL